MAAILLRKIPLLVQFSEAESKSPMMAQIGEIKEKIKSSRYFSLSYLEILLQKTLSKIRILSLRFENKTAFWLHKLRERKKTKEKDNYWEGLKKSVNGEDENSPE